MVISEANPRTRDFYADRTHPVNLVSSTHHHGYRGLDADLCLFGLG